MPNEFISNGILLRVIIIENNSSKYKSYGANLAENNEENDLHHIIGSADINESRILSNCIYININESRQNLYLKLIFIIHNLSDDNSTEDHKDEMRPIISYNLHGDRKPLNDGNNPDFFLIAFPTLFFYRDGGHIAPQSTKVSLYA